MINMRKSIGLIVVIAFLTSSGCETFEINEEYVKEKITYLSSNELRGRRTFSPEIEIAAEYIANEFSNAGLEEFEGSLNHIQEFSLFEISQGKLELIINDQTIDDRNFVAQLNDEVIEWQNSENVIITYIKPEDDFYEEYGRFRRNDDNLLVIVAPEHRQAFERYSRFFSRANRTFELGSGRSIVMAISEINEVSNYHFKATASIETKKLSNVVGAISGERTDEYVLFSAHYDHIGIRKANNDGDSIANGANDDASGTVAVMALAKYFATQPKPERTLLFVAFTAEEMGGYGSRFFSNNLSPDEIVAMFNIEMIGKPAVSGPNTAWISGWDKSDFGPLLQASAEGTGYEFYADPYPDQNLFYRSDNATLARLGVPAHSISTTPIDVDQDYHQVTDEVATLDIPHLTNTVKAIVQGAKGIISGEQTPTRVNPDEI